MSDFNFYLDVSQHLIGRIFTFKCFKSNNFEFLIYVIENNFLFAPKYSKRVSSMNVTKRLIFQNTRQRFVSRRRSFHLLLMYVYPTKEHVVQLQSKREKGVRECERMYETRSKQTTILT